MLAPLEPHIAVGNEDPARHLEPHLLELEHHPARALRRAEREGEGSVVARLRLAGTALEPLDALQLRLRLARLGRLVSEALDEALHARDLGLAAGGVAAGGELAGGLLDAPRVPRPGEEARPAGFELEHRGTDRFEEPAVVSDQDDGRVELDEVALEPLERLDVEMVRRLVEEQQVRPRGERSSERGSRQLAAREGRQGPIERGVVEAEPADRGRCAIAPAISAGELEPRLSGGVAGKRLGARVAARHASLEALQLALDLEDPRHPGEHVGAQRRIVVWRALVVQRDPGALADRQRAAVDPGLAREHPQQGGLAAAVAPRERHAVAVLELERDVAEKGPAPDVLGQAGGGDGGQG